MIEIGALNSSFCVFELASCANGILVCNVCDKISGTCIAFVTKLLSFKLYRVFFTVYTWDAGY